MILEGRTLSASIRANLAVRAQKVQQRLGRAISLCAIGSTEDYGAQVYLQKEVQAARNIGIEAHILLVNNQTPAADFLEMVRTASADDNTDAILIPRPLPAHLAATDYASLLAPQKDIDGMSVVNAGRLFLTKTWADVEALPAFVPCTAMAAMRLLAAHQVQVQGKEAVVIGRSTTVGRPLAHLLTCQNATVKICHTFTDLPRAVQNADIVCSAAGKAGLLQAQWLKPGAVVIDISTNWQNDRLCGDADPVSLAARDISYSPVPGGVGPVTLAVLLENLVLSGERKL